MSRSFVVVSLMVGGLALAGPAVGQTPDRAATTREEDRAFRPRVRPELEVRRAPGEIEVDGSLDDPGWAAAARATGFTEAFPDEDAEPAVATEAWITYDDENLYLAFVAEDDPATIRTSIADRDAIFADDIVGILLDTYADATWAYEILVNPSGVQADLRMAGGNEDAAFDLVFESDGRITERGYEVEIAVPFESLRFPDRPEQVWRATFVRIRPRASREQHSWAALRSDVECFLCQFGTIRGIEGIEPGGAVELLPSLVASRSATLRDPDEPASGLGNEDFDGDASLGFRYAHPSGITTEATVNPDFSQVESDVAQIDVNTTFALFFPERRPFFQEGSDLFETFFDAVHTRQINDPDVAAKTIARLGRTSFAYLGARDANTPILLPFEERSFVGRAEESISNVLRARRTYAQGSHVGALVTDRRFERGDGSGTTWGVDGVHRFLERYRLEYQVLGSYTVEADEPGATAPLGDETFDDGARTAVFDGERFGGSAHYVGVARSARHWSFDVDYRASSPTFRADNGFEFRNDYRRLTVFQEYAFWPDDNPVLDRFTPDFRYRRDWDWGGTKELELVQPSLEFTFKRQTFVELGWEREYERFRGIAFDDMRRWWVSVNSRFSEPVEVNLFYQHGDEIARNAETPFVGSGTDLELSATIKPIDRWTIDPAVSYARLETPAGEEVFDGYVFRTRTTYNVSRKLFVRFVVQWDDFDEALDVEPLVTYKINPFTLFFVGSTQTFRDFGERHDGFTETDRQYFAKFQYLFRL